MSIGSEFLRNKELAKAEAGQAFALAHKQPTSNGHLSLEVNGNGKGDIWIHARLNERYHRPNDPDATVEKAHAWMHIDRVQAKGQRGGENFTTTLAELRNLDGTPNNGYGTLLTNTAVQVLKRIGLPGDRVSGYIQNPNDMGRHEERRAFFAKFFEVSGSHVATTVEQMREHRPHQARPEAQFAPVVALSEFQAMGRSNSRGR
jgi:hypothetical protein